MREVRECDFCGADATGVYDVLPAAVGTRRVLLCDECRETLTSVVDPLVDALEGAPGEEPPVEHTAAGDRGDAESAAAAGDGGARTPTERERDDDPGTGTGSESGTGAGAGAGAAAGADGNSGPSGAKRTRKGAPRGYRKVVRFLENRDFPMDRAEAEAMAADAYGLDRDQVAAAIDHAVKHGRLREASGELRK